MHMDNLTETDTALVHKYWKYKVTDHILVGSGDAPATDYTFFLPLPERLAGLTYVGHAARLRLALERARQGQRLRVGTLGGSITAGQGVGSAENTYIQLFMDWLNAVLPPRPVARDLTQIGLTHITAARGAGAGEVVVGSGGAGAGGTLPRTALRQRMALRESDEEDEDEAAAAGAEEEEDEASSSAKRHAFINGAIPGTESAYTSSCLYHHLIPNPDLVFVDYAINDMPTASWTRAGPQGPYRRAFERLVRKLLDLPSRPAVVLVNMFAMGPSLGKYWYTAERDFAEFATYYGLPSVSLKAAVLPALYVGGPEELTFGSIFNGGLNHPGRGGHVIVAELLITLFLELLRSAPQGDTAAEMAAVAARPLPPPMGPGNFGTLSKTCYIEEELQALVQGSHEGWEWTDEGRKKWGYVATELDRTIRIKVNTQLPGDRTEEEAAAPVIVQIAHLQSYRGMGTATVVCVEGCDCAPVTIDAYDPREVSLTFMADVKVSQHPRCVLELTSRPPSRAARLAAAKSADGDGGGDDKGHKFKLMGVVVGEEPGAKAGSVVYLRHESHELWRNKTRLALTKSS